MNGLRQTVSPDSEPVTTDVVDVSVIIVNYNVREFLQQALQSVRAASGRLNVEVFVVDNDSADGSVEMVRERFPEVRLIVNPGNVGFSKANNQAIGQASGRHLLILNPDTILQEDTIDEMVHFLDSNPDAGAAGCQILNPDGSFAPESRRAFPTPRVAFYRISGLSRLFPQSPRFGRYNMTFLPRDAVAEIDALSGSCMMVRHAALYFDRSTASDMHLLNGRATGELLRRNTRDNGAGVFDEDFFMYGEDLDWCYRIQQAGWKIFYIPSTRIIHYKGESTKKGELRYVRLFYGAMVKFAEKHLESRYSGAFTLAIRAAIFARATVGVVSRLLRRLAHPALEFALVFLIVTVLGSAAVGASARTPLFLVSVAGGFALLYVALAAIAGSYRRENRRRLKTVWRSMSLTFVLMAAVSFFFRDIAYSRLLLLASFAASGAAVSLVRLSLRRPRSNGDCRVLLIGTGEEARRLRRMLASHPSPPFILVGHVITGGSDEHAGESLGPVRQLRDIVRLHRIDDVVFANKSVSNQEMFMLMQRLQDLPIQFRILAQEPDRIIGKSTINEFGTPSLVDASATIQTPRSTIARRSFEIPVALGGLLLYPFIPMISAFSRDEEFWSSLKPKVAKFWSVLLGRRALVGYDPELPSRPPREWRLKPGVFSVSDTMVNWPETPADLQQVYWFYMQHQSASADWDIMLRSLRSSRR